MLEHVGSKMAGLGTVLGPSGRQGGFGCDLELYLGGSGTTSWRQDGPGWRQDRAMLADLASKKPPGQHFGEHFGSFLIIFDILDAKSLVAKSVEKPTVLDRFLKVSGVDWGCLGSYFG